MSGNNFVKWANPLRAIMIYAQDPFHTIISRDVQSLPKVCGFGLTRGSWIPSETQHPSPGKTTYLWEGLHMSGNNFLKWANPLRAIMVYAEDPFHKINSRNVQSLPKVCGFGLTSGPWIPSETQHPSSDKTTYLWEGLHIAGNNCVKWVLCIYPNCPGGVCPFHEIIS